jgi:dTDP-4-dehydrorhamnose 3,5-epimerase
MPDGYARRVKMQIQRTSLPEVLVIEHEVFEDERGFFMEVWRADQFAEHAHLGLPGGFVQVNHSRSSRGVARGLHFQWDPPVGKLMRVIVGEAYLVAVDIRPGSPTLGRHESVVASADNKLQMWAPASFARGFCTLSDFAEVEYFTTGIYNPAAESGVRWNDPDIGIDWPIREPILSAKDAAAQSLSEWLARPEAQTFRYPG